MRSLAILLISTLAVGVVAAAAEAQVRNQFVEACGSSGDEISHCVIEAANGDLIVTGYQIDGSSKDVFLGRFTAQGGPIWWKNYGGAQDDEGFSVVEIPGGDLVLVGYTRSRGDGADFLISRFTSSGTHVWTKTWGRGSGDDEELHSVIQATTGYFWATGYTKSFAPVGDAKVVAVKFTASPTDLDCSRAGKLTGDWELVGESIAEVFDTGGFCITGSLRDPGLLGCDTRILLAKFNHSPSFLWADRIGTEGDCQMGTAIVRTDDACLALAGNVEVWDSFYHVWMDGGFVLKTDANAQWTWAQCEPCFTLYQDLRITDLWQTHDHYLVATGLWHNFDDVNYGIFLTRWSLGGVRQWNRSFEGGTGAYAYSGIETSDSGLMVAGVTSGYGAGGEDLLLARCDAQGETCAPENPGPEFETWSPVQESVVLASADWNAVLSSWTPTLHTIAMTVTDICQAQGVDEHPAAEQACIIDVSPNPFFGSTAIRYQLAAEGAMHLEIYDTVGRLVRRLADGTADPGSRIATWNGEDESGRRTPAGIYYARLRTESVSKSVPLILIR
jgi:hypothetical protein